MAVLPSPPRTAHFVSAHRGPVTAPDRPVGRWLVDSAPVTTNPVDGTSQPQPRSTIRRHGIRLAGIAISVIALGVVLGSVDLAATVDVLVRATLLPLAVAFCLVPIQVAIVTVRWRLLLPRRPDGTRPGLLETYRAVWVGYLGNLVLPARLGEVVRSYLIARREALDFPETLGTAVLERIIDTATLAILAWITSIAVGAPGWLINLMAVVAVGGAVALGILATIGPHPFVRPLMRIAGTSRIGHRLTPILGAVDRLVTGMSGASRRRSVVVAALLSVLNWSFEAAIFVLVAISLGIELSPAAGLLVAGVTVLGTAVPSAPGYVGTYELAATATATALGVPEAEAFALALLAHATTVLPLAIGGTLALASLGGGLRPLVEQASDAEDAARDREAPPIQDAVV